MAASDCGDVWWKRGSLHAHKWQTVGRPYTGSPDRPRLCRACAEADRRVAADDSRCLRAHGERGASAASLSPSDLPARQRTNQMRAAKANCRSGSILIFLPGLQLSRSWALTLSAASCVGWLFFEIRASRYLERPSPWAGSQSLVCESPTLARLDHRRPARPDFPLPSPPHAPHPAVSRLARPSTHPLACCSVSAVSPGQRLALPMHSPRRTRMTAAERWPVTLIANLTIVSRLDRT
ncbi:hypothetical protein L1887_56453 [Cichorium endivia]|nr:hypothetical protein L1887_56453 [Cichorium endivia]